MSSFLAVLGVIVRPHGVNDLQVLWAIRDIPASIIEPLQRHLLMVLVTIIGNKPCCNQSLASLSKKFGIPMRSLLRLIESLEAKKFLHVKRHSKKGRGKSNQYILNYDLILTYLNSATLAPLNAESKINSATMAPLTTLNGATVACQSLYKRDIKSREENLPVDNFQNPNQDQKLWTKETYQFNNPEREDSYRRDIQIQICFNKFIENLHSKNRTSFKQSEWDKWYAQERPGKHAKADPAPPQNAHYEKMMQEHQTYKEFERKPMAPDIRAQWDAAMAKLKGKVAL